jgi:anti-sigma regulatory factor (Ser/Thr protein kinase)
MLELSLEADPSALARMADEVEAHAAETGIPPERAMQLVIALDEIVTNIVSHGGLAPGSRIAITVAVQGDAAVATVEDPGPAFDPLREAPPPVLSGGADDRPIGGLGLHIVKTIMAEVGYERREGRNRLVMRLPL